MKTPMQKKEVIDKLRARASMYGFEDRAIGIYADHHIVNLLLTAAKMIEDGSDPTSHHVQDSGPIQARLVP